VAFLGDFGKFFGLGSSEEVLGDVGSAVGGFIGQGPQGALIGQQVGKAVGRATSNLSGSDISPASTADQALEQSAVPVSQVGQTGPAETSNVGITGMTQQAGFGSLIPGLIGGARSAFPQIGKFLGTPTGSIGTGIATGVGVNMFQGSQMRMGKPVLTQSRRNKARVRQLVNFMGIEGAGQFLSQASGQNVSGNDVVQLLLRTFRNDGAFITKAQVRNLRRTTNRFKSLEKQVKEATSMSRTTRRPVMRRASSTTLIKN
jgi:hypothetical protein